MMEIFALMACVYDLHTGASLGCQPLASFTIYQTKAECDRMKVHYREGVVPGITHVCFKRSVAGWERAE